MRRVVVLVESPDHVYYRYRFEAFREGLCHRGWSLQPEALEKSGIRRLRQFARLRHADAVVLQRKLLPVWQQFALRRGASVLIYDFDDAVLYRDSYAKKGRQSWNRRRRFSALLRSVDRVIAGNAYLADLASQWCPRDRITTIPTCLNPGRYALAEHRRSGNVELCWIGSRSTAKSFGPASPIFEAIGRDVPGVRLRVISDTFPSFHHLDVIPELWSQEGETAALAGCDIGVSWLPDDLWSRGKCGLKVIQYMAAGLPVVANAVGPHLELVEHEKTGFLAETVEDWCAAVSILAENPALRRQMGTAGRQRVVDRWSVASWTDPLAACLNAAVASRLRTPAVAPAGSRNPSQPGRLPRPHAGRSQSATSHSTRVR